jgi:hypothetical protein
VLGVRFEVLVVAETGAVWCLQQAHVLPDYGDVGDGLARLERVLVEREFLRSVEEAAASPGGLESSGNSS